MSCPRSQCRTAAAPGKGPLQMVYVQTEEAVGPAWHLNRCRPALFHSRVKKKKKEKVTQPPGDPAWLRGSGGGTWQRAGRPWGWGFGAPGSAGPCASKRPPPRHRAAPPPRAASRTRGSKHSHVIRARPRLSPPISSARWTCSPPLRTGSMSRFPAVAGRAPRRQEEGERPRELQEERPSAVCIADRGAVRGTPWQLAGVVGGAKSTFLGGRGDGERAQTFSWSLKPEGELCVQ